MSVSALEPLLRSLPQPHLLVSVSGRILAANPPASRVLGDALAAAQTLAELVADPPERVAVYLTACSGTTSPLPGALTFRGPEGDTVKRRCNGALVRIPGSPGPVLLQLEPEGGPPASFLLLTGKIDELRREVRERRRIETQLRETAARLRGTIQASPLAIVGVNPQARITLWNPAAERIFGWTAREVLGRPVPFIPDEERPEFEDRWNAVCQGHSLVGMRSRRRRKDGSLVDVSVSAAPMLDADGIPRGAIAVLEDISQQLRAEDELRRAREAAETASHAKSQFLAVMSHELRTPLTGIIGYADLLGSDIWGPTNELQRTQIARIKAGAWHLVSVIDEILTFSRAEAGKEEARLEPVDLPRLAHEVAALLEPQATDKGIALRVALPGTPLEVETDPAKLRQILFNLVGNAVKFTEAGHVALSLEPLPDGVVIRVTDTGPGIPPEQLERIFEPFTQLDDSHTRLKSGTGLGLAVCRRLAELLDAEIAVEHSALGAGSTFVVQLPAVRRRNSGLAAPFAAGDPSSLRSSG